MNADIRSFARSVAAGTIVGGGPFMLLTVPLAIMDGFQPMTGKPNLTGDLYLAVLPILVSLATVLFGSIVIGIPSTIILRKRRLENRRRYVIIGVAAGFLIPLLGLIVAGAEWGIAAEWGLLGSFSGYVTAFTWSKGTNRTV